MGKNLQTLEARGAKTLKQGNTGRALEWEHSHPN